MSELLTAKDVELKMFKRASFGGYAVSDVEEFLNQIAEDLEVYAFRLNEQQRRLQELEKTLKEHESMKDTIQDALILAQKSARNKEEEAMHQASLILSKAESKLSEVELEVRRRQGEAENSADDVVAAARTAAAQIIKNAEEMREEAQKRLDSVETEIDRRMAEANKRADEISVAARVEARHIAERVKHELEENKRELGVLRSDRERFLKDSAELVSLFEHMIGTARQRLEKETQGTEAPEPPRRRMNSPFSMVPGDAENVFTSERAAFREEKN